jgi:hypothetical protein
MDDGYQYFKKKHEKSSEGHVLNIDGWMKNDVSMTI